MKKEEKRKEKEIEKERQEKEKKDKEKQEEKERKEKERKEKEEKEEERKEKEKEEKVKKERERKEKEFEEKEKEEKEEKEREEKLNKEKEHAEYYPDGICSTKGKIQKNGLNYIHLEIKFVAVTKDVEIYDVNGPSKPGYKVIKYEINKYYIVFPFYKTKKSRIYFGIREIETKKLMDNKDILENDYLKYNNEEKRFELEIIKEKSEFMTFNIYNVPKEINKISYIKFLHNLNLKDDDNIFSLSCIKEVTKPLKYNEIIDLIMEIGINELSEKLIIMLKERNCEIYQISDYLEKNKDKKFKDKEFKKIAPNIIYNFVHLNNENDEKLKNLQENFQSERNCLLCCDKNIPISLYSENYQKDLIDKTSKNLGNLSIEEYMKLQEMKEKIKQKLCDYNKNQKLKNSKEIACILTDTTVKKISQLEFGIQANIPMIIQGFTSAGKSFLSKVASEINNRECLSTALSEHTTTEDFLGRDIIKNDSSITFIPGILLLAYTEGKTLILDECDLAKPEILSCILGSISKSEVIVNNKVFRKTDGYNVILTMNGEVKGFNEKQRNILTSNILSKFIIIHFDEMEKEECQEIFIRLLKKNDENSKDYINKVDTFIELHQKMIDEMKNNVKSIDPIVTLRNLKYCCYLNNNSIPPRNAAEISYTARFPENERKDFEQILKKLGDFQIDKKVDKEIEQGLKNNFLYYNESYKKCAYLALTAIREGLHPLLIGEKGSGITILARLIASIYKEDYEFILCCSETSVEDLIGCYQPKIKTKDGIKNLSSYIKLNDGPILRAAREGIVIILDNITISN